MPSLAMIPGDHAGSGASERALKAVIAGTVLAASATAALATSLQGWVAPADVALFWVLAALCLLGELVPIRLPRIPPCDLITMSSGFAFAILLAFGLLPAMAVYAAASAIADLGNRTSPAKAAFNVSQYVLALVAAGAALRLLGHETSVTVAPTEVAALLAAAAAFMAVNHALAGTAAALLTGHPVARYLRADLGFHFSTAGLQLALAPIALLAAGAHLALVPLVLVPLAGIYLHGRRVVAGARLAVSQTSARA